MFLFVEYIVEQEEWDRRFGLHKITLGSGAKCEWDRGTGNHGSNNSFSIRVSAQEALLLFEASTTTSIGC